MRNCSFMKGHICDLSFPNNVMKEIKYTKMELLQIDLP
jgi:hypothetical protein